MKLYLLVFLLVFLSACAPVISVETREGADSTLTFKEVAQNPNYYEGKTVIWGGEIIQILPQDDGSTILEVLEWPLGWAEEPKRTVSFQGEFLVISKERIDTSRYRQGAKITVVGEIQGSVQGEKIQSISDPTYRYPLLVSKEIHVWEHPLSSYSDVPDYRSTWEYRHYDGILNY